MLHARPRKVLKEGKVAKHQHYSSLKLHYTVCFFLMMVDNFTKGQTEES